MELEDLKTKWTELDSRLEGADSKIDLLAAHVAAGKFTSAKQRLIRRFRLGIIMLSLLPLWSVIICFDADFVPGVALTSLFVLFVLTMLVREILLWVLLNRIDPCRQTVREAYLAVLRFRNCYYAGVAVGIALAVPLLVVLGGYMEQASAHIFRGFVVGGVCGLLIGIVVFRRVLREIDELRTALKDTAE